MAKTRARFEGQVIHQTANKVTGAVGHPKLNTSLHVEDEVTIVGKGRIIGINHKTTKNGLQRVQTIEVEDGFLVDGIDADDLIHKLRAERQAELDKVLGTSSFDFNPDKEDE